MLEITWRNRKILRTNVFLIVTLFLAVSAHAQTYTVERVIDGDTIKLTNGERVRLIGIDTPESKPNDKAKRDAERTGQDLESITKMGQEATEFVKKFLKEGQEVRLEFDVQERDKYGRLLAYVYIQTNFEEIMPPSVVDPIADKIYNIPNNSRDWEIFLNGFIVHRGYAQPMTIPPNVKHAEWFKELYEEARREGRGLWKKDLNLGLTLKEVKRLCESTGGDFISCAIAFYEECKNKIIVEGLGVICSCQEGKVWDIKKGCH